MRLAIIHWYTRAVGGIATRVNTYRKTALKCGDTCDILLSKNISSGPKLYPKRKWSYGGDTRIWIDGIAPHGERSSETINWINNNYDAVIFSFMCPHPCPTYQEPKFLSLYEGITLPKISFVSDWYWDKYADWANMALPYVKGVATLVKSYADTMLKDVPDVRMIPVPFMPQTGRVEKRSEEPLVVWTNQWRSFKGPKPFLSIVPKLNKSIQVELYSNGIRYYQLRTLDVWKDAVGEDRYSTYPGHGKAIFFGNVDLPKIAKVYQRAWFSVNLQGMYTNKKALKEGSHNNAEIEALFYGTCPVLHESTLNTVIPNDCFIPVAHEKEIPAKIHKAIKSGFAIDSTRQKKARDFVVKTYWHTKIYKEIKDMLGMTVEDKIRN